MAVDFTKLDARTLTLLLAGGCTLVTTHLTMQLVSQHLYFWKKPKEQKAVIVIVLMAPIYALDSFFGLVHIQGSEALFTFLDAIKECYEALVIAKFLTLMYSYVGISISRHVIPDNIKGRKIGHSFPMTLFMPHEVPLNEHSLRLLKWWTWQFVIIRPVLSVLMIALQLLGLYKGAITWIVSFILNTSVSLAMYSLLNFYHLFGKELAPHKPLPKFLCVKGVVFFSFWQGLALKLLAAIGVIQTAHKWLEIEQIEEAYQNLLICVEMVVFAYVQQYAFHVAEYSGQDDVGLKRGSEKKQD